MVGAVGLQSARPANSQRRNLGGTRETLNNHSFFLRFNAAAAANNTLLDLPADYIH